MNLVHTPGPRASAKTVVFDLDDTLYLEKQYVASGFRHIAKLVAKQAGASTEELVAFLHRLSGDLHCRGRNLDLLVEEYPGIAISWDVSSLIEEYRAHRPSIAFLPGIHSMLQELRSQGANLAIITDGAISSQHEKIEALKLGELVDMVIVTDDMGIQYRKPNPRGFLKVAERFNCQPFECIYIGDNPAKDFVAPRQLGWDSIRFRVPDQLHFGADAGKPEREPGAECQDVPSLRQLLLLKLAHLSDNPEARLASE